MDNTQRLLHAQARALWATLFCFVLGAVAGLAALWGTARPFTGEGSVIVPTALITGVITAGAFVVSTLMHRRGETFPMPRWQAVISDIAAIAVTIAIAGVAGLGVLLAGEIIGTGLQGLELSPIGGGLIVGVAAAVGGRLAFDAGIELRTGDIAALLFAFLIIGTLFAMITAADPTWWQRNFSQLGSGGGGWAFNGTLVIAGMLVATTGLYIGRDLHRLYGDRMLRRIAVVALAWVVSGLALAAVGLLPINRFPTAHDILAVGTMVLIVVAVVLSARVLAGGRMLRVITTVLVVLVVAAVVMTVAFSLMSVTALESIVIGLVLLWMTTFARVLAILGPTRSRPSHTVSPLRTEARTPHPA
ncbi:DUF998 domain-containing protein [Microbacterium esteraromaticum]|uniref:DUF998 domain-containing protein n=1 Tax=Microbacterium esteraromaticum TaxID=57043 RepID=UPI00236883AD|nr:DUF998 domain-containing protein [Microbacterium esteraromaticum]WDH79097.1 DUF998 domain-containing protein [Microbacterium esteraromaticum]